MYIIFIIFSHVKVRKKYFLSPRQEYLEANFNITEEQD